MGGGIDARALLNSMNGLACKCDQVDNRCVPLVNDAGLVLAKMTSETETGSVRRKEEEMRQIRLSKRGRVRGIILSGMALSMLFMGTAHASVVRQAHRASGACMMNVALDKSGRSVSAGAFVNCFTVAPVASGACPSSILRPKLYEPNRAQPLEECRHQGVGTLLRIRPDTVELDPLGNRDRMHHVESRNSDKPNKLSSN